MVTPALLTPSISARNSWVSGSALSSAPVLAHQEPPREAPLDRATAIGSSALWVVCVKVT